VIEAVVFDWGGTLSIWVEADLVEMWRLVARHLAPDNEDEVCGRLAAIEERAWQRSSDDHRSFTLQQLLREASAELGLDVEAAVFEEAGSHYLDAWTPHISHDPDAVAVLTDLRARGLAIGLLSNTHWPSTYHEHFLERDGLASLIDARLYTSELEHTKPHPEVFGQILDALGVSDPATAVFVGDRPIDDIHGAKSAGLRAVLRTGSFVPGDDVVPDAVIDSLPELLPLIDAWSDS
jgi:putative hydrolase of the HAD superfamily